MTITKQPLFVFSFWLFVCIAALHHLAIFFYLYWTVWWFDIIMHFLGGAGIATAILWLFYWSGWFKRSHFSNRSALILALMSTFVIGLGWEFFEAWGGIIFWPEDLMDSYSDMVMDLLGSVAAFINSLRYRKYLPYGK